MKRMRFSGVLLVLVMCAGYGLAAELPLGEIKHDGPPTPEQICVYIPVKGELSHDCKATVRYKKGDAEWKEGHPLHRIRPKNTSGRKKPADAFAGAVFDLTPGTAYEVEVTVTLGQDKVVKTLKATTRSLPGKAGESTKKIAAGTTSDDIKKVFNGIQPGDVVQFANGTYTVSGLQIKKGGTAEKPVYIRGESRDGVVLKCAAGNIIQILKASHVILEDMTFEGSKKDSGTAARSKGIAFWNGAVQQCFTIRRTTFNGVDMGIIAAGTTKQMLVYDNTLKGNNEWTAEFTQSNKTWNDDGIRMPGQGNAIFNNTLTGFGDSLAVCAGVGNVGVHFYRNDILMTGDDAFESDYGVRNISYYDNRAQNSMTHISVDPMYGGPFFAFRNISINTGRQPYKLNNRNTGFFLYNNTVIRTNGTSSGKGWAWVQYNNGPLVAWAYRNNLLIFHGKGKLMAMESSGQNPVDFDYNGWYPDGAVWWSKSGGSAGSLDAIRKKLPATKPLFGKSTKRHTKDLIIEANPFAEKVELPDLYIEKQVTKPIVPKLADGAKPREAGVAIPGITDGFKGKAPDMGAIITGRPLPVWGDRSNGKK